LDRNFVGKLPIGVEDGALSIASSCDENRVGFFVNQTL